jgi:hypothetical protein
MTEQERRRWWLAVIAAVVVAAAVAIGVPVRMAHRSGAAAGTQLQVDDHAAVSGRTGSVLLPTGALAITVTGPETHFPSDADPYGDVSADRVERSGRWVGVGWALSPPGQDSPATAPSPATATADATVTVTR